MRRASKHSGRRRLALLAALALLACGIGAAEAPSEAPLAARLFVVNVGKGDALLVQAGGCSCLIDTGKAWAMGRVRSAMDALGITALDAVFITHPDDDHVEGLEWLAASDIPVGAWYASAMYTEVKPDKHPVLKAAKARDMDVIWLQRGDSVPLGTDGISFEVLSPSQLMTDKDDNNSLVMMLHTPSGRMLLTGDMELPQEATLLAWGDDLACSVLKIPNHGDGDATGEALVRACAAEAAVISTDGFEKPGTPDPGVLDRLEAAGTAWYVTEESGLGIDVRLAADGSLEMQSVPFDQPESAGVRLSAVLPGEDLITLTNDGGDCDLSGWYLFSEKGDEIFSFPDGTQLSAGAAITVGTRSSKGSYDLLWDDKKVIHPSKSDVVRLYDCCGRCVDARDNGL